MKRISGTIKRLEKTEYFVPYPLPPKDPAFIMSSEIVDLQSKTILALAKLNEISHLIPSVQRFVKSCVMKEAQLSSSIEGINTTLLDAFTTTLLDIKANKETQLVLNYFQATQVAVEMIQKQNMPLINRVINTAHATLLQGSDGQKANPGKYRQQSVRVGNLIPAPAFDIPDCMSDLEKYINDQEPLGALIQAGLAHVQFETIHPFLDGNGRIGRMLIVLMLLDSKLLSVPMLYPSYYFKKYHYEYYDKLDTVRRDGDFESWILFYLKVILESSQDAYQRALEIHTLHISMNEKIKKSNLSAKKTEQVSMLLDYLFENPVISISTVATHFSKPYNSIKQLFDIAQSLEIIKLSTKQTRNKVFVCFDYLNILDK